MRIAVDAMGGDNAPRAIIEGVIAYLKEEKKDREIILVGDEEVVKRELSLYSVDGLPISIEPSKEVIEMEESPAKAIRTKKRSSIVIATNLVRDKKADALVSAGNTGAVMGACFMSLGRLKGILRPAIATLLPTLRTPSVLLDVGANVDCKPQHLFQFAVMGSVYARYVLKKEKPKVGLLSIGEERTKGNGLVFSAHKLIEDSRLLNFIGNVEGRDIVNGKVDVIVCDGFVGNIVLKFGESFAEMIMHELKEEFSRNLLLKIGSFLVRSGFRRFRKRVDYSEYGGAPLLGIDGVCIICHGSSGALAIKNGVNVASEFVSNKVNVAIEEGLRLYGC
ncbi:MAG: phosphate acyltransferase PlsX [bacterium]|nr:phosphate acyltransferase PlsX [bacterium]